MTSPETLRELARLRPEKFGQYALDIPDAALASIYWRPNKPLIENHPLAHFSRHTLLSKITQDDIDSILAELDRRVLLILGGLKSPWNVLTAMVYAADWKYLYSVETNETEKNPAMRKALTAVVEEIKKGEKG